MKLNYNISDYNYSAEVAEGGEDMLIGLKHP